ncbi:hypothetical protein [Helicobacter turcicus]|uniref:Periplasmic protein n=1 Tax=Helicobacter turcicus TaxID=2867412 RepID=A0ABS7JLT3_9HELI|nr:hypothetical protein [Helicobacter turcicus]MBX7490331.1 hypothetical protein [Helicobacter turcicus]MBX7545090.1 hypothetical protein [Helicobacter turcicus]
MQPILRVLNVSILALSLIGNTLYADTFVSPNPPSPPKKQVSVTPLTPFDEALKREMQKYPKDSAFFVDGRTGKIISVNRLPKESPKLAPKPTHNPTPKPTPKIPYKMQEERIELL